jgi:hypothetical protein
MTAEQTAERKIKGKKPEKEKFWFLKNRLESKLKQEK